MSKRQTEGLKNITEETKRLTEAYVISPKKKFILPFAVLNLFHTLVLSITLTQKTC